MNKIRSRTEMLNFLDAQFAWRLKEIDDIKKAIRAAEDTSKRSIVRAGVPILYAHWEGFVKSSSEALLNFINYQGHRLRLLHPCYIVFGAKKLLHDLAESGNPRQTVGLVEFFLRQLDQKADLSFVGAINTESNLSSTVFDRIARSVGVDPTPYETKYILINKSLLDRRNHIAHGERLDMNMDDFRNLSDEVIFLLRSYKTDLENIVNLNAYLVAPVAPHHAAGT